MKNKDQLALLGGEPTRKTPFPKYPVIGEEEKRAVMQVLESGNLSTFSASTAGIKGGQKIQEFEKSFIEYFGVKHAVAVNSATAGLHCALAAVGCGPGDEVIVPPYTFTATATSVLMHNSIPIFSDIEADTFCLDPALLEEKITSKTKAIIPVHLLGHPADMDKILAIARKHKIAVIEDNAQSPGAKIGGRLAGTIGDLGVFSFQETKNIAVGEGGMIVTNNDELAERCRMVRNHGEVIIEGKKREYLSNIIGWNYRMTELEAAVGVEQMKKFDRLQAMRKELFLYLMKKLANIPGITPPYIKPGVEHAYHIFGLKYDEKIIGLPREIFMKAVQAEGIPCGPGYPRPLYENPVFKEKIAYGMQGCPFSCVYYSKEVIYKSGICPVAEEMCRSKALWIYIVRPPATIQDMDDIASAINKVYENRDALK